MQLPSRLGYLRLIYFTELRLGVIYFDFENVYNLPGITRRAMKQASRESEVRHNKVTCARCDQHSHFRVLLPSSLAISLYMLTPKPSSSYSFFPSRFWSSFFFLDSKSLTSLQLDRPVNSAGYDDRNRWCGKRMRCTRTRGTAARCVSASAWATWRLLGIK
jgi:hypothetical protein